MLERMIETIQEQLNLDGVEITENSSFIDDLGADSLDFFELVMVKSNVLFALLLRYLCSVRIYPPFSKSAMRASSLTWRLTDLMQYDARTANIDRPSLLFEPDTDFYKKKSGQCSFFDTMTHQPHSQLF